jgi:hypothetical protein
MKDFSVTEEVKTENMINVIEIDDIYCAFKITSKEKTMSFGADSENTKTKKKHRTKTKEVQGVCKSVDYQKALYTGNIPSAIKSVGLFSPKQLNLLAQFGWGSCIYDGSELPSNTIISFSGKLEELKNTDIHKDFMSASIGGDKSNFLNCNKIFDVLSDSPELKSNIVTLNASSHMVFSLLTGRPAASAIYFDYYGNNHMSNAKYDLEKVAEVFVNRDATLFMKDTFNNRHNNSEGVISEIPHYNAEDGMTHYINCYIKPTQDEYDIIWDECLKINKKVPSVAICEAIWNTDVFGFKAFDKHPKSFWAQAST